MKARFELILYHFYSKRSLKSSSSVMPAVAVTERYYCRVHKRIEYLYGTDVDSKTLPDKIPEKCLLVKTVGGFHLICTSHSTHRFLMYLRSLYMTLKYHGDIWWWIMGFRRGKYGWRIFGKYVDYPLPRVENHPYDDVLIALSELYDIAKEVAGEVVET